MKLHTEHDLAELLTIEPAKAAELRRRNNWPHVRLGRFDVRYTDSQVEQIIASQSVTAKRDDIAKLASGQSSRSAAKKAS